MGNPSTGVQQYLSSLHDVEPGFVSVEFAALPLHLRSRYSFLKVAMFGQKWVLAIEEEAWEAGTPGEYRKQIQIIGTHAKTPVALVLPHASYSSDSRIYALPVEVLTGTTNACSPCSPVGNSPCCIW